LKLENLRALVIGKPLLLGEFGLGGLVDGQVMFFHRRNLGN